MAITDISNFVSTIPRSIPPRYQEPRKENNHQPYLAILATIESSQSVNKTSRVYPFFLNKAHHTHQDVMHNKASEDH